MHMPLTRIVPVVFGWCLVAGCTEPTVVPTPEGDGGPPPRPDLGPDIAEDVQGWSGGLPDTPALPETGGPSCVTIDGSSHCVTMKCSNGIVEGTEECDDGNGKP